MVQSNQCYISCLFTAKGYQTQKETRISIYIQYLEYCCRLSVSTKWQSLAHIEIRKGKERWYISIKKDGIYQSIQKSEREQKDGIYQSIQKSERKKKDGIYQSMFYFMSVHSKEILDAERNKNFNIYSISRVLLTVVSTHRNQNGKRKMVYINQYINQTGKRKMVQSNQYYFSCLFTAKGYQTQKKKHKNFNTCSISRVLLSLVCLD